MSTQNFQNFVYAVRNVPANSSYNLNLIKQVRKHNITRNTMPTLATFLEKDSKTNLLHNMCNSTLLSYLKAMFQLA